MQRYGSLLGLLLLLAAGVPVVVGSRPAASSSDDLEHNRQLLEKWRKDPEHYQRLRENLDTFWSLPPAEQQRLRQLDQELHAVPPDRQKRLMRALVRYNTWLNRLRETDPDTYARIQSAPGGERLALIREVRRHQWIESLPDRVREQLVKLPPEQQGKEIARLRKEEIEHRREWMRPDWLHWPRRPRSLSEFPLSAQQEVHQFVSELLIPHLNKDERESLKRAEGKPAQTAVILGLAQQHPEILPPLPGRKPITTFQELPAEVQKVLTNLPEWKRTVRPGRGPGMGKDRKKWPEIRHKWPDFALTAVSVYEHHLPGSTIPPLGASRPTEFPPLARDFIEHQLPPVLSDREKKDLKAAEGKWPKYPHLVRDLARQHQDRLGKLMPPLALPGPVELWLPPGPGERGPGKRPHPPKDTTPAH